jgi:predicted DNA-binding transcriptional regulator AlpA
MSSKRPSSEIVPPWFALLITREEAAALCRVSVSQLDSLVSRGNLPQPVRDLGRPLWRRSSLEDGIRRLDTHNKQDSEDVSEEGDNFPEPEL